MDSRQKVKKTSGDMALYLSHRCVRFRDQAGVLEYRVQWNAGMSDSATHRARKCGIGTCLERTSLFASHARRKPLAYGEPATRATSKFDSATHEINRTITAVSYVPGSLVAFAFGAHGQARCTRGVAGESLPA